MISYHNQPANQRAHDAAEATMRKHDASFRMVGSKDESRTLSAETRACADPRLVDEYDRLYAGRVAG